MKKMLIVLLTVFSATVALAHDHHPHGQPCAKVFQSEGFTGAVLKLRAGAHISNLNDRVFFNRYEGTHSGWDNRISSVIVNEGCKLVVWQYQNFGRHYVDGSKIGWHKTLRGADAYLGWIDNKASSLVCSCR